jgi:GTP:adenosylcobinamide-phosphate guanylyltransferase
MNRSPSFSTVILAGGVADDDFKKASGTDIRAMAPFGDSTMLDHVVRAITASTIEPDFADTIVIGNIVESSGYKVIADSGTFTGNLAAGLREVSSRDLTLVSTADIPFITTDGVNSFLRDAVELMKDEETVLVWPVIPVQLCYEKYPGIKRTAIKLHEGMLTGGNVGLVRPQRLLDCLPAINRAFEARKSPLKLAGILGPTVIARLLVSQAVAPSLLTIPFLEAAVSRLIGGKARAVICNLPEIATDIDRAQDYVLVKGAS